MRAWLKSFVGTTAQPPAPKPFAGFGVYLSSEVHSPRSSSGPLPPAKLGDAISSILGYQSAIIEAHGGTIEQFVGDCVIAYWEPSDAPVMVGLVCEAATEIVREKVKIPELDFCLRVNFSAADLAGAFFGPVSSRRYQVIGKARDRANSLPRFSPGVDCIFTDAETFAVMPTAAKVGFAAISPTVYSCQGAKNR